VSRDRAAVAPAPDGNAGGLDVAAIQGRAELAARGTYWRDDQPDGWQEAVESLSTQDVPALLAEVRSMSGEILRTHARPAEAIRERDRWHRTHDGVLVALAAANRERDEARAKAVDGGEWGVQYGHQTAEVGWVFEPRGINYATSQRPWWMGPPVPVPITFGHKAVEPVTDDGGVG
jgi:hypothetical protein